MSDLDLSQGNLFSIFGEMRATLGGVGDTMQAVNKRLARRAAIPVDYISSNSALPDQTNSVCPCSRMLHRSETYLRLRQHI